MMSSFIKNSIEQRLEFLENEWRYSKTALFFMLKGLWNKHYHYTSTHTWHFPSRKCFSIQSSQWNNSQRFKYGPSWLILVRWRMFKYNMENVCTLHEQDKFIISRITSLRKGVIVLYHYRADIMKLQRRKQRNEKLKKGTGFIEQNSRESAGAPSALGSLMSCNCTSSMT